MQNDDANFADSNYQAKKVVSYAESADEDGDDDDPIDPSAGQRRKGRPSKRIKTNMESDDDDDDVYVAETGMENGAVSEGRALSAIRCLEKNR